MIKFNELEYYSIIELSHLLKCSEMSVRRYVREHAIAKRRFGRKLYVSAPDVEKLLS